MKEDEILTEYVAALKAQNDELSRQLKERPRSFLGISEMWSAFWSTIGGMWKDFWSTVSSVCDNICNSEGALWGASFVSIVAIIATAIVTACIYVPDRPTKPIAKLTEKYYLSAGYNSGCYYIVQEREDGTTAKATPCIKDKDDALKVLREIKNVGAEGVE